MDDKNIVALLWQSSEQALQLLAKRFGALLYRLAMNILGDRRDAEETVSDTYLALWNTIPPEKPDPLTAYVCRVGKNAALKKLRDNTAAKRDSRYDASLDELSGCLAGCSLEEEWQARELGRAIDRFLELQTQQNRIIFLRRYWFGDSVKEIAGLYAMSPGAVSVRLSRLRDALKDYLIKEGFGDETQAIG
jgi:RNA polymerase sigma-70 factor (ECF subfamily)